VRLLISLIYLYTKSLHIHRSFETAPNGNKTGILRMKVALRRVPLMIVAFLILRRIQRYIVLNILRSSCRVPVILIRF